MKTAEEYAEIIEEGNTNLIDNIELFKEYGRQCANKALMDAKEGIDVWDFLKGGCCPDHSHIILSTKIQLP